MLHQLICSQEQIDLTVDGIVYKPQKSDHSVHFLLCCDWPLVPKLTVIGQQEIDQLFRKSQNFQIFYQMNWFIPWFMLANELIQHSRNTSIATTVREKKDINSFGQITVKSI